MTPQIRHTVRKALDAMTVGLAILGMAILFSMMLAPYIVHFIIENVLGR